MSSMLFAACLVLLMPALAAAQQAAPNGEAVYTQHCAGCHEGTVPRMPSRDTLRGLTPAHVETMLGSWTMRRQGAALDSAERRAVAEFLTGRPAGSYASPIDAIADDAYCRAGTGGAAPLAGSAWNGWGNNQRNTRAQSAAAAGLSANDVPGLTLKWAFGLPGVSASGSQVTVLGSRVFVGSRNGMIYSLDKDTGCIAWTFEADYGVRSTPVAGPIVSGNAGTLYFGDAFAQVYALDIATGALRWKVKVDDHLDAMITAGLAFNDGRLYVGVASLEEGTAGMPTYECCTFRGSIVSLDAATGRQIWKTYAIEETPGRTTTNPVGTQLWGPAGAGIWSTPVVDPDRNRIYVTTGDSYSNPPSPESDAVMALDLETGRKIWVRQTLSGDAWNTGCFEADDPAEANCPEGAGPDFDFGSSPVLATLADGREVLLAGQKSGMLYGLNPDTGAILWQTRAGAGGVLGGIEWGFAVEGQVAYASLSGAFEQDAGEAGGMVAVNAADGAVQWTAPPPANLCGDRVGCNTAQPAAVTAIPGVVFSGSLDGHLRAYETETGRVLWDLDTGHEFETVNGVPARGGSFNGPGATLAGGMLFVTSGYSPIGFMSGNVLLAFAVD